MIDIIDELSKNDKECLKFFLKAMWHYYAVHYQSDQTIEIESRFRNFENYRTNEDLNIVLIAKIKTYLRFDPMKALKAFKQMDDLI